MTTVTINNIHDEKELIGFLEKLIIFMRESKIDERSILIENLTVESFLRKFKFMM